MAAKKKTKSTAKKTAKKGAGKRARPRRRVSADAEPPPPAEPGVEQVTKAASQAIQASLEETKRVIEGNLEAFRRQLESVRGFVEQAVADMQLNQAQAMQQAAAAAEAGGRAAEPPERDDAGEGVTGAGERSADQVLAGHVVAPQPVEPPPPGLAQPGPQLQTPPAPAVGAEDFLAATAVGEGEIVEAESAMCDTHGATVDPIAAVSELEGEWIDAEPPADPSGSKLN